jgi:hypothetical protein
MLARVNDDGPIAYPRAIEMSADYLRDGGQAVMFFSSEARLDDYVFGLGLLRAKRIRPAGIFMDDESFLPDAGPRKRSGPGDLAGEFIIESCPVYRVSRGDDLGGIFV